MRVRTYITDFSFDYLTGVRTLNDNYTQLIEYTYDESQTYFAGYQGYMEVIPTQPTSKNRKFKNLQVNIRLLHRVILQEHIPTIMRLINMDELQK